MDLISPRSLCYTYAVTQQEKDNVMTTVLQAKETIDNAIQNFKEGPTFGFGTINAINFAVNSEIQLRDYLIGLPNNHELDICSGFLSYLTTELPAEDSYGLDTVNAIFQYELGNLELCAELLEKVSISNSDYSLASLVRRAISAGWPASTFSTMRQELPPKVIAHLNEIGENLIA